MYYLPINNLKNENHNVQDLDKAKKYFKKFTNLQNKNGIQTNEDDHLLSFLFSAFKDVPKNLEEASKFFVSAGTSNPTN